MQYETYQERPEREWVVYLVKASPPQCWTARLFPSLDRVRDWCSPRCKDIYESPSDLARRFGGADMLHAYRVLRERTACRTSLKEGAEGPHVDDLPDSIQFNRGAIALALYELIQDTADRIKGISDRNQFDDEEMYIIRLDLMTTPQGLVTVGSYNKQKRIIAEALIEFGKSKALETELEVMVRELKQKGILKTKQDPFRIFKYYAPELGDDGFLYYPSKRHKLDDQQALSA